VAGAADGTSGTEEGRAVRFGLADLRRAGAAAVLDVTTLFSETRLFAIVICFLTTRLFLSILVDSWLHPHQKFLSIAFCR
jgi:hypothetical protein